MHENINLAIPCHEPEQIESARKRKGFIDDEKIPNTSFKDFVMYDVEIQSRYRKAHEYELMRLMVHYMTPAMRSLVRTIFCDSKACSVFTMTMADGVAYSEAKKAAEHVHLIAKEFNGGHNGVFVDDPDIVMGPFWNDDVI